MTFIFLLRPTVVTQTCTDPGVCTCFWSQNYKHEKNRLQEDIPSSPTGLM